MSKEIAATILEQLGGRRFLLMTGAKNLVDEGQSLTMGLPSRMTSMHVTHYRITLAPSDTYTCQALKNPRRGSTDPVRIVCEDQDVHAEDLQRMFTRHTGLDTVLPSFMPTLVNA